MFISGFFFFIRVISAFLTLLEKRFGKIILVYDFICRFITVVVHIVMKYFAKMKSPNVECLKSPEVVL